METVRLREPSRGPFRHQRRVKTSADLKRRGVDGLPVVDRRALGLVESLELCTRGSTGACQPVLATWRTAALLYVVARLKRWRTDPVQTAGRDQYGMYRGCAYVRIIRGAWRPIHYLGVQLKVSLFTAGPFVWWRGTNDMKKS